MGSRYGWLLACLHGLLKSAWTAAAATALSSGAPDCCRSRPQLPLDPPLAGVQLGPDVVAGTPLTQRRASMHAARRLLDESAPASPSPADVQASEVSTARASCMQDAAASLATLPACLGCACTRPQLSSPSPPACTTHCARTCVVLHHTGQAPPPSCPDGSSPAVCEVHPCAATDCGPDAMCEADLCHGCNAVCTPKEQGAPAVTVLHPVQDGSTPEGDMHTVRAARPPRQQWTCTCTRSMLCPLLATTR